MECIILAGGLGTRLQSIVSDLPKCMASVAGKPFLHYLLTSLEQKGFNHVILSLGYKHEMVIEWLKTFNTKLKVSWVVEQEPLGTGGALRFASQAMLTDKAFIINGDTYFEVDYLGMMQLHEKQKQKLPLPYEKWKTSVGLGLSNWKKRLNASHNLRKNNFAPPVISMEAFILSAKTRYKNYRKNVLWKRNSSKKI